MSANGEPDETAREAEAAVPATVEPPAHLKPFQFRPGQSGNYSGRSKTERAWLSTKYGANGRRLYEQLDAILKDPKTSRRLKVHILEFLIERLHGKAVQRIDVGDSIDAMAQAILTDRVRHADVIRADVTKTITSTHVHVTSAAPDGARTDGEDGAR